MGLFNGLDSAVLLSADDVGFFANDIDEAISSDVFNHSSALVPQGNLGGDKGSYPHIGGIARITELKVQERLRRQPIPGTFSDRPFSP